MRLASIINLGSEKMSRNGVKTFRAWLWDFLESDCPIGDLARDAKLDSEWKGLSAASLNTRLRNLGADGQGAREAMSKAAKLYQAELNIQRKG